MGANKLQYDEETDMKKRNETRGRKALEVGRQASVEKGARLEENVIRKSIRLGGVWSEGKNDVQSNEDHTTTTGHGRAGGKDVTTKTTCRQGDTRRQRPPKHTDEGRFALEKATLTDGY
ncbi:hypothetical protein RB195_018995 [Necator americanus]|uniref:Uncharacterized protein n=1 Tax=Necator americanus TaxID=51031 RepID=A0ABR1CC54_NECAM